MSSIRPLATITLLALVGVFLYMKISETEPPLPADIANWTMPAELEISQSPATPSFAETSAAPAPMATSTAPAFAPASPATSTAPAFSAAPRATTMPSKNVVPPESTAPTFPTSPPAFQPQTVAAAGGSSMEIPDLPLLPAIPATGAAAAPATAEASPPVGGSAPATNDARTADAIPAPATAVMEQPQSSLFSATRLAVQAALDRGELSQALLLLSDWYGDPSLSPSETQEVNLLLSQLAGSVIYSTEHRLEPPYMVQAGEGLQGIARKYDVPWQLLAKINGLSGPDGLQPGQHLKVVRGPFSALVDLSQRRMTLMLDRRYAGQFAIEVDPTTSVEEGHWTVNQKLITPGNVGLTSSAPRVPSDQKSIMMTNTSGGANQIVILRGANGSAMGSTPGSMDPAGRVIRLKIRDVEEVYDILSLGSQVVIRR